MGENFKQFTRKTLNSEGKSKTVDFWLLRVHSQYEPKGATSKAIKMKVNSYSFKKGRISFLSIVQKKPI